jgi:hypothetical protein
VPHARYPLAIPPEISEPGGGSAIDAIYSVERAPSRKPKTLTEGIIRQAFADAGGNATRAARLLGVHKATLYRHIKALGLNRKDFETIPATNSPNFKPDTPNPIPDTPRPQEPKP